MAINYELLNKGGISLGTNFELLSEKPLDSRLVVPSLEGLQNYIDNAAAYEGLIAYVSSEKKHYEVKVIDGVLSYRPFGLTEAELNEIITNATTAAMEFKGATAELPEEPTKGDMWKVVANFNVGDEEVKVGDSIVYNGEQWFVIPSGDDIEDTWRPVEGVNNDATLKFVNGDKTVAVAAADGTIKYNHATVADPQLIAENEQTRTYITAVETDGYGHITGYKTATENVEDTNTEYTFESQVESSSVYFNVTPSTEGATEETIYVDAYSKNEANDKFVAKEGYITFTQDEKDKLAGLSNYDDEEVRGLIGDNAKAIEDLEEYVGTIPTNYTETNVIAYINKKAEETLAAAQGGSSETAASVKQQLDNYKSENDTRVKAAEDAIDVIEADYLKAADKTELSNAIAGVKATAEAAATKAYTDEELTKKVAKADYEADKATFATKTELGGIDKKFENYRTSADQDTIDNGHKERIEALEAKFTGDNSVDAKIAAAVATETAAREEAVAGVQGEVDAVEGRMATAEGKITALETASATHALKSELEVVDAKFANYKTAEAQKAIDDEQDRRLGVIEGDYLKAADIANFETKENVKKVADDLAAYVESNDEALAAETKARTDADAGFETRIAALEGNFGDGEGTVEAQIEAAVNAEKLRAEGIESGLRTDVDAIKADYLKATDKTALEGKITAEETRAKSVEESLQTQINTIMNNPDAEGAINSINEFTQYVKDHGTIADGFRTDIDKNKEDIAANTKAIGDEAARADAAEKALAGRVDTLEAINHNAYVAADTALKTELQAEIDSDVAAAIAAEVTRSNAKAAELVDAAKTEAANQDAVVLAEAQAYTDQVAAAVDTGVMEVEGGNDIVVTPGENGKVTIAHAEFTTGAYAKNPAESDKTGDVYLMTGVTVDNGHVTGANVQSLAAALAGMTFIIDGGNSTNV